MFEITINYTQEELQEIRELGNVRQMPKWKGVGIAVLSVLPSIGLLMLTKSFIVLSAALVILVLLLGVFLRAYLKTPKAEEEPPVIIQFHEDSKKEFHRNCVYHFKWHMFEEWFESESSYVLRRLDSHTLIPKRCVPPEHRDEFKACLAKVGDKPEVQTHPVDFYNEISSAAPEELVEFSYQADDLLKIGKNWEPLTGENAKEPEDEKKKQPLWPPLILLGLILAVGAFLALESPDAPDSNSLSWSQWMLIAFAIVLPFLILYVVIKIVSRRTGPKDPKVPSETNYSVLLKNGWLVGNQDNTSLYEWRDVDEIYDNTTCYGLKLFSNLIIVIPKRIFKSKDHQKDFINKAVELHREYRRSFAEPVMAIETGNPYQPPAS